MCERESRFRVTLIQLNPLLSNINFVSLKFQFYCLIKLRDNIFLKILSIFFLIFFNISGTNFCEGNLIILYFLFMKLIRLFCYVYLHIGDLWENKKWLSHKNKTNFVYVISFFIAKFYHKNFMYYNKTSYSRLTIGNRLLIS